MIQTDHRWITSVTLAYDLSLNMDLTALSIDKLLEHMQKVRDEIQVREDRKNAELFAEWQQVTNDQWKVNLEAEGLDPMLAEQLELFSHWSRPGIKVKTSDGYAECMVYFETRKKVCVGTLGSGEVVGDTAELALEVFAQANIDIPADKVIQVFCPEKWRPERIFY